MRAMYSQMRWSQLLLLFLGRLSKLLLFLQPYKHESYVPIIFEVPFPHAWGSSYVLAIPHPVCIWAGGGRTFFSSEILKILN
jgi:hypothetical protein